jgi:hypothetical protein
MRSSASSCSDRLVPILKRSEEGFTIMIDRVTLPDPTPTMSTKQSRRDYGRLRRHERPGALDRIVSSVPLGSSRLSLP